MNFTSGRQGFYEDVTMAGGSSSSSRGFPLYSHGGGGGGGGEEDSDDHVFVRRGGGGEGSSGGACYAMIEKEHMFDKVVTPSDVGKLNRLVIPKQHAEKYFPLDSSSNEKGLLLNFEDRHGKPWRFRYSYWNSSQSYVMTKGWSRFVKDKKLDAGDIVSFQRGVGELGKDRLFIDWRRRPDMAELPPAPPQHFPTLSAPHQFSFHRSWNHPLFLHPQLLHPNGVVSASQFQRHYPYNPYNSYNSTFFSGNPCPPAGSIAYSRSGFVSPQEGIGIRQAAQGGSEVNEVVFESVPVVQGKAAAKRLRLFGVNMDCPISDDSDDQFCDNNLPSPSNNSSIPDCLQLRPYNQNEDDDNNGKGSSMSLDLDI